MLLFCYYIRHWFSNVRMFCQKKKEFCLNKMNKKYVTQRKRDKNKTTFVLSKRK